MALQLLALYLAGAESRRRRGSNAIRHSWTAELLARTLKTRRGWNKCGRLFGRSDFLYLGRGINFPIALEGALKLKEISYIHAEGYPAGEMKHGPIALIDEQVPVVAIAPRDDVFDKMFGNIQEAKARGGSIVALTTEGHDKLASVLDPANDFTVSVPQAAPLLMPILLVLPLQLLAYHVAVRRGATSISLEIWQRASR